MLLEQLHGGKPGPGGNQRRPFLDHVTPVLNGAENVGVGAGPPNSSSLERLNETGFGVTGRRLGGVTLRLHLFRVQLLAHLQGGQNNVAALERGVWVVRPFHVGPQETRELDYLTRGAQYHFAPVPGRARHTNRSPLAPRVCHLRRYRALPDEVVQFPFVVAQLTTQAVWSAKARASRTNRFVGFLGILGFLVVGARRGVQVFLAIHAAYLSACGAHGFFGQRGAVGSHIGNVTTLVQPLRGSHGALGCEAQFASAFLLECAGDKRRVRALSKGFLLERNHLERLPTKAVCQFSSVFFRQNYHFGARLELARFVKVFAGGNARAFQLEHVCGEFLLTRPNSGLESPVACRCKTHPLTFALHQHSGGHALHPPRTQFGCNLFPQDRADLVTVQAVQRPPGFLGLD